LQLDEQQGWNIFFERCRHFKVSKSRVGAGSGTGTRSLSALPSLRSRERSIPASHVKVPRTRLWFHRSLSQPCPVLENLFTYQKALRDLQCWRLMKICQWMRSALCGLYRSLRVPPEQEMSSEALSFFLVIIRRAGRPTVFALFSHLKLSKYPHHSCNCCSSESRSRLLQLRGCNFTSNSMSEKTLYSNIK
jgi:hypothetical protein